MLIRVKSKSKRLFYLPSEQNTLLSASSGIQRFPQREISAQITLYPTCGKDQVHYIIVANPEVLPKEDQDFSLRVMSNRSIELVKLPEIKTDIIKDLTV